jgi:hypothetical protein
LGVQYVAKGCKDYPYGVLKVGQAKGREVRNGLAAMLAVVPADQDSAGEVFGNNTAGIETMPLWRYFNQTAWIGARIRYGEREVFTLALVFFRGY